MTDEDDLEQRAALLRTKLAAELSAELAHDSAWLAAFERVPRHTLVPVHYGTGRSRVSVDDPGTREEWLTSVYTDTSLVTHLTDGGATSSSTQPSLMARMLRALLVADDSRVLEIGTGTGYNAALLAHRLGDERVTSIDVSEEITGPARERLAAAGYHPRVITGDGAVGTPGARYDRIIATCRADRVPTAWLDQLAPGGMIVAPIAGGLARVHPSERGATGEFLGPASFMAMRSGPGSGVPVGDLSLLGGVAPRRSVLPAAALADTRYRFLAGVAVPGLMWSYDELTGGVPAGARCWDGAESVAELDADGMARQAGPRALWSELERAYIAYQGGGRPTHDRYGLTVSPDGAQRVWLDTPAGPAWPL
ncbi:methyltransferase domain-containing protein [Streptomyces otsuchiensis]|uniref:methyltransferase domain-containing protein n=1 Tax=Streptomyces otsuchiensis TaxID=2681388 RepID=UPI001D1323A5|nr:methyltransferase domain-containing protein [Streptomyces otsuchiensis]